MIDTDFYCEKLALMVVFFLGGGKCPGGYCPVTQLHTGMDPMVWEEAIRAPLVQGRLAP